MEASKIHFLLSPFLSPWKKYMISALLHFAWDSFLRTNFLFPLTFCNNLRAGRYILKRAWVCKNCTFLLHKWDKAFQSHTLCSDRNKDLTNFLGALQGLWKSCSDQVTNTTDPISLMGLEWFLKSRPHFCEWSPSLEEEHCWPELWQCKSDRLTIASLEQNLSHRTTVTAYGSQENSTRDTSGNIFVEIHLHTQRWKWQKALEHDFACSCTSYRKSTAAQPLA